MRDDTYGVTGTVQFDEYPENPRDWDNIGTMVCQHSRYNLGDTEDSPDSFKDLIVLPLYLYDHSGITMNTTGFSCGWDSGQVGIIYAKKGTEGLSDDDLRRCLEDEVKSYDAFLTGMVFEFVITDKYNDVIDSCSGYLDDEDLCREEMEHALKVCIKEAADAKVDKDIKYVLTDWQYEVVNNTTVLGFKDWQDYRVEAENEA